MAYTTIDDPSAHFQIKLYTGNGNADLALTNDGNSDLQPDLVWIKSRSSGSLGHRLYDTSRGAAAGDLRTHGTNGETQETGDLESFDSDGFTVDDHADINTSSATFVAWQWKANGGTRVTFTESGANPAGGHQANTTAGFSIVDYTGTGSNGTVAHGLGVQPEMVWVKRREGTANWCVKTTHIDDGNVLFLDLSAAQSNTSTPFNDTDPDATVFTIGDNQATNENDGTYVAYCWASIQGYSKCGSYEGNGNADGAFVYTGFKPAWVLVRRTETGNNWHLVDNKRDTFNPTDLQLYPNLSNAEYAEDDGMDFLSNGFKIRESANWINEQELYVYMAFAENPFVTSGGVPCTAE